MCTKAVTGRLAKCDLLCDYESLLVHDLLSQPSCSLYVNDQLYTVIANRNGTLLWLFAFINTF